VASEIAKELEGTADDPDGIPVSVMISFYQRPEK
jgi:hypothetical protein